MRLSDEKINHLSHVLAQAVAKLPGVSFPGGQNVARLKILDLIRAAVQAEDALQEEIRRKISSSKKDIPEGSHEWDILSRRYYEEAMARLIPPDTTEE